MAAVMAARGSDGGMRTSAALRTPPLPLDCIGLVLLHLPTVRERCIAMAIASDWRAAGLAETRLWHEIKVDMSRTRGSLTDACVDLLLARAHGRVRDVALVAAPELTMMAVRALRFNGSLASLSIHSPLLSGTDILRILPLESAVTSMCISGCSVNARELRLLQEVLGPKCSLDVATCEGCDAVAQVDELAEQRDCAHCGDELCARCVSKACGACGAGWCADCADTDDAATLICQCSVCATACFCRGCFFSAQSAAECSHCGAWVCASCVPHMCPCDACGEAVCCNRRSSAE